MILLVSRVYVSDHSALVPRNIQQHFVGYLDSGNLNLGYSI